MCLPSKVEAVTIQRIASFIGSLSCLNFGLMFGITPTHIRLYQSPSQTPLHHVIKQDDATWITAYLFLGASAGALLFGQMSNRIGPKSVLLISGLLQIASWFAIHFAYDIIHIFASRVVAGVAAGATFVALPIFIVDIAEKPHHFTLLAFTDVWRSTGTLLGFALAAFIPYSYVNIVGISVSMVFNMAFPFVQESPYHFQHKGNVSGLEKSLRWYRGVRDVRDREDPKFLQELAQFKSVIKSQRMETIMKIVAPEVNSSLPLFYLLNLLLLCAILFLGAQLTGIFVILNYGQELFNALEWSSERSVDAVILILAASQFIGTIFAVWIGSKANRRLQLSVPSLISGLSLGTLMLLLTFGGSWQVGPFCAPWLPVGLLALHMLAANMGAYPLASILMMEILPPKLRLPLISTMASISWLLDFALVKFYHLLIANIGLVGCLGLFCGCCIFMVAFAIVVLPETRNKELEQVQQDMGYNVTIKRGYVGKGAVSHVSSVDIY